MSKAFSFPFCQFIGLDEGSGFILFLLKLLLQILDQQSLFVLFLHNLFFGLDKGGFFRSPSQNFIPLVKRIMGQTKREPRQNQLLMLGTKIQVIAFFGGPYRSIYSGLFKSTLNNAQLQRNWLYGFMDEGRSLSLRYLQ